MDVFYSFGEVLEASKNGSRWKVDNHQGNFSVKHDYSGRRMHEKRYINCVGEEWFGEEIHSHSTLFVIC